jgi:uncharacterized protein YbjQ (UPF0145 family)
MRPERLLLPQRGDCDWGELKHKRRSCNFPALEKSAAEMAVWYSAARTRGRGGDMAINVSVNQAMVTTAFELAGYRVVRSLGLVRGVTVRSRSIFGTLGASLQTMVGGNITLFEDMCEQTRQQALDLMLEHAIERGGNAVIGMRYDATEVMQGVTEVIAYGTAVQAERAA